MTAIAHRTKKVIDILTAAAGTVMISGFVIPK
jgi:hypothetical protein